MNIIELAKKAGFRTGQIHLSVGDPIPFVSAISTDCRHELERFAALVLEEAAKVCEEKHANGNWKHDTRHECAAAIRALKGAKE